MARFPRRFRRPLLTLSAILGRAVPALRDFLVLGAVALALSVALWLVVTTEQNPPETREVSEPVPVQLVNAPPHLMPYNSPVEPVRVLATAPRDVWTRVSTETFYAQVSLAEAHEGRQQLPVEVRSRNPLVQVIQVTPSTVPVRMEVIERKSVPVEVEVLGTLPFGYVSERPRPQPQLVTVSGPASLVNQVERVQASMRVDGSRVTINRQVEPVPINVQGLPIRDDALNLDPGTIRIEVPIVQQIAYRTVPVNATIAGTVPAGYWLTGISVTPAAVTITGSTEAIETVNFVQTAPIDVSGLVMGTERQATVVLPDGIGLTGSQTVTVAIDVNPLQGSQTFPVQPQVIGLGPDLAALTTPVRITVAGDVPRLRELRVSEIQATVDVLDLGPGTYSLPVEVTAPPGFQVVAVTPGQTTVFIQEQ